MLLCTTKLKLRHEGPSTKADYRIQWYANYYTIMQGAVNNALKFHPDGVHVIYPVGSMVVIKNSLKPEQQHLLHGHTNLITCLDVSKSGKYIASGQVTLGHLVRLDITD